MLLTTKVIDGRPRKSLFSVTFSAEEVGWMTRNGCLVRTVEARRLHGTDEMEFVYPVDSGGSCSFQCKPEDFFTELHKTLCGIPVETIAVKANLPEDESE